MTREIEKLRKRVKELEDRTETASDQVQAPTSNSSPSGKVTQAPRVDSSSPKRPWEQARRDSVMGYPRYYGPSSAAYFNTRMCRYLENTLSQPFPESLLEPVSARSTYPSLSHLSNSRISGAIFSREGQMSSLESGDLSQSEEIHFLNLFLAVLPLHFPDTLRVSIPRTLRFLVVGLFG